MFLYNTFSVIGGFDMLSTQQLTENVPDRLDLSSHDTNSVKGISVCYDTMARDESI